eukprot:TRINITY_DN34739_c0_g1_i1.p1 TRINITY_DN34739_c0_g1~~TRINITY_DN34739_c0_g1_i1.p1  ORF type:complete len:522 (+),score=80.54 TRINITY_DN34739_c0_g1_i1:81-1646(+)
MAASDVPLRHVNGYRRRRKLHRGVLPPEAQMRKVLRCLAGVAVGAAALHAQRSCCWTTPTTVTEKVQFGREAPAQQPGRLVSGAVQPPHGRRRLDVQMYAPGTGTAKVAAADSAAGGDGPVKVGFNTLKMILGVGILSLSSQMTSGTGWIPASLTALVLGFYNAWSFSLFGRLGAKVGAASVHDLGETVKGPRFALVLDWASTLFNFFVCWAYAIVIGDVFADLFHGLGLTGLAASNNFALLSINLLVVLPLCMLRDMSSLSFSSLLGVAGMLYTTGFIFLRALDGSYSPGGLYYKFVSDRMAASSTALVGPTAFNISSLGLMCVLSTAYASQYCAQKTYGQLRVQSKGRFNSVVFVSFGIASAIVASVMCVGYSTFGPACKGFLLNLYAIQDPLAIVARAGIGLSIVGSYPLMFSALRDGAMALLKTDNFTVVTLVLVATLTGLASVIKDVGLVCNVAGALFGSAYGYMFPGLLYLAYYRTKKPTAERFIAKAGVAMGVFFAVVGTGVALLREFAPGVLS